MSLAAVRRARGLTQDQLAKELGLAGAGSISPIENGVVDPSLELALRIQVWSAGKVRATDLRPDLADLIEAACSSPDVSEARR